MKYITTQANFKSGRLSEKLHGRVDVAEYQTGLSIADNTFIDKSGGGYKRFGIKLLADLPAVYDDSDGIVFTCTMFDKFKVKIVFGKQEFTIFDEQGNPIALNNSYAPTAPEVDPKLISVAVYENYVIFAHYETNIPPTVITFTEVDNLTLAGETLLFASTQLWEGDGFFDSPFKDFNTDQNIKIRVEDTAGNVARTLRATSPIFNPSDQGKKILIRGIVYDYTSSNGSRPGRLVMGYYDITNYISSTEVTANSLVISKEAFGAEHDTMQAFETASYAPIDGETGQTFPVGGTMNTRYYTDWAFQAWNVDDGYPRIVAVDEGRLLFGGTKTKPATLYGSKVGDPFFFLDKRFPQDTDFNYDGDIIETDPYQFTIAAAEGSTITYMQPTSSLVIGTTSREYIASGAGALISKKNVSVRPHTAHGSKPILTAVYDTNVFYVGSEGRQLFLLRYSEENQSFLSKEISVLFDDIFDDDDVVIVDLSFNEDLGILFVVLSNGECETITVNSETGTLASAHIDSISNFSIVATHYNRGVQTFLCSHKDTGNMFLAEFSQSSSELTSNTEITRKIGYGDLVTEYVTGVNDRPITRIDLNLDMIYTTASNINVGDAVYFQDAYAGPNLGGAAIGSNIVKNQIYYAIPVRDNTFPGNLQVGIRIALTPADAIANNYIDLTGSAPLGAWGGGANETLSHVKIVRTISLKQFPVGAEITILRIEAGDTEVQESQIIKQAGQDVYDLGVNCTYVAYGLAYEFHLATLPIEAGQQWGSSQLGIKRPDKVSVRYYKSYSFLIGTDGYNEEEVIVDDYSTGRKEIAITANSEYDSIIHIRNTKMEPCYIINMTIRGLSNDG